jgi:hypothetical protein
VLGNEEPNVYVASHYFPTICHESVPTMPIADLLMLMHSKASELVAQFVQVFA